MEKTISYLNDKTWYRFLKVIFIIGCLIILAIFNLFVFSSIGIKQVSQPMKNDLTSTKMSQSDFVKNIREKFPQYKDIDDIKLINAVLTKYPQYKNSVELKGEALINSLDAPPTYTYRLFFKWFLVGNFIFLLIFETIRRSFYYIILGTIKPKK